MKWNNTEMKCRFERIQAKIPWTCYRDNTTWVVIPVATVAAWIRKMPIFRYRIFWNVISRSLGQALFPPRSFCHSGIPIALTTEFTTRPLSGSVPLINRLCVPVVPATIVSLGLHPSSNMPFIGRFLFLYSIDRINNQKTAPHKLVMVGKHIWWALTSEQILLINGISCSCH